MNEKLNLSPPWITFYNMVKELFAEDKSIEVVFDQEANEIKLYVEGASKAEALTHLMPAEKQFGNVIVKVTIIPANVDNANPASLIERAFEGNPALSRIITGEVFGATLNYVLFDKKVVQFYNDDISDAHGLKSTLYQDIAREVFSSDNFQGIFYCTENKDRNAQLINSLKNPVIKQFNKQIF